MKKMSNMSEKLKIKLKNQCYQRVFIVPFVFQTYDNFLVKTMFKFEKEKARSSRGEYNASNYNYELH